MLVTLPAVGDVITSSTVNATAVFDAFLPFMYWALGIFLGVLILMWLIRQFKGVGKKVFGGGRRGGRSRRRR